MCVHGVCAWCVCAWCVCAWCVCVHGVCVCMVCVCVHGVCVHEGGYAKPYSCSKLEESGVCTQDLVRRYSHDDVADDD